jgi:hypothetical protein
MFSTGWSVPNGSKVMAYIVVFALSCIVLAFAVRLEAGLYLLGEFEGIASMCHTPPTAGFLAACSMVGATLIHGLALGLSALKRGRLKATWWFAILPLITLLDLAVSKLNFGSSLCSWYVT